MKLYNLVSAHAASPTAPSLSNIQEANLPSLTNDDQKLLLQPLKIEEITAAIADTQQEKAPGPDGFTLLYYKAFQTQLAPNFTTAFNAILEGPSVPPDMLRASISVIPKPEKDPLLCSSYRPISLLNCDIKLFTKILASRLKGLLQRLVANDQVGFIQT